VYESPAPKADAQITLELFTNLHRRLFLCAWIARDMHDRRAVASSARPNISDIRKIILGEARADEGDGPHPGGLLSGQSRTGS
jgi:hypothetical protein